MVEERLKVLKPCINIAVLDHKAKTLNAMHALDSNIDMYVLLQGERALTLIIQYLTLEERP